MALLRVRVGSVLLSGQMDSSDGTGHLIAPDGFQGWDDGVDVRRNEIVRPRSHGDFDVPGDLGPRVISISGTTLAHSPASLGWFRSQLTGLLADGGTARVVVDHQETTMWANARLASKTKFTVNSADQLSASFQIQFWAADPRKYAKENIAGPDTVVSSFHRGNFPASPWIDVTGDMPSGYSIWCSGRQFAVSLPLLPGQTHRIDMATGRLYQGGTRQVGAVLVANLWVVPPGAVVAMALSPVSGSGQIVVRVVDTFI